MPHLPRLLIDLELVCGYRPLTIEEYQVLKEQIQEAFFEESSLFLYSYPWRYNYQRVCRISHEFYHRVEQPPRCCL